MRQKPKKGAKPESTVLSFGSREFKGTFVSGEDEGAVLPPETTPAGLRKAQAAMDPSSETCANGMPNYDNPKVLETLEVEGEHYSDRLYTTFVNLDLSVEERLEAAKGLREWAKTTDCDIPFDLAQDLTEDEDPRIRTQGYLTILELWSKPHGLAMVLGRASETGFTNCDDVAVQNAVVKFKEFARKDLGGCKDFDEAVGEYFQNGFHQLAFGDADLEANRPALFRACATLAKRTEDFRDSLADFMHHASCMGSGPAVITGTAFFDAATKDWVAPDDFGRCEALGAILKGVGSDEEDPLKKKLLALSKLDKNPEVRAKALEVYNAIQFGKVKIYPVKIVEG